MPRGLRRRNHEEERARGCAGGGRGEGEGLRFHLRFFLLFFDFVPWDRRRRLLQKGVRGVQVSTCSFSYLLSPLSFFFSHSCWLFFFLQHQQRRRKNEKKLISLFSPRFFSLFLALNQKIYKKNRYIAPGFVKLCKSANSSSGGSGNSNDDGDDEVPDIVFLKHDVERDGDGSDSDEDSDGGGGGDGGGRTSLAVSLKIRSVPLFHVYRGRELVASFATRDR